jgi:hypothetical protein
LRKRYLVLALGLVLAIGVAAVAMAANTHFIKAKVTPTKQKKDKYGAAAFNFTTASTCQSPCTLDPASRVQIFIDDDLKIDTKGLAQCTKSKLEGTTTEQAKSKCGKALVGAGQATAFIGGNPSSPVSVTGTEFNGPPKGGKPTLLVHARTPSLGFTTVLEGVYKPTSGDFGYILDVSVPPLPFGTAISSFQAKVQKAYSAGGKKHNYVKARCHDGNKTWNFKGKDTYPSSPSLTASAKQKCQVKS